MAEPIAPGPRPGVMLRRILVAAALAALSAWAFTRRPRVESA
jgi:hypothetical protein